mgnify:CR=1 FL=1
MSEPNFTMKGYDVSLNNIKDILPESIGDVSSVDENNQI